MQKELESRTQSFEKTLAEKDDQVSKCEDVVQKLRAELDEELCQVKCIDKEILGECSCLNPFQ